MVNVVDWPISATITLPKLVFITWFWRISPRLLTKAVLGRFSNGTNALLLRIVNPLDTLGLLVVTVPLLLRVKLFLVSILI